MKFYRSSFNIYWDNFLKYTVTASFYSEEEKSC
jgi:hypothetical protein